MNSVVIAITSCMSGAGRMSHEENAARIQPELNRMVVSPSYNGPDVLTGRWILMIRSQSISHIDPRHSVTGEIMQNIGVDLRGAISVTFDERAAMHENNDGKDLTGGRGEKQIEFLSWMGTVGDIIRDARVPREIKSMYLGEFLDHQAYMA